MTSLTLTTTLPPATGRAGIPGALLSEWTKIRTVRSTKWSIAAMAGIAIGLNALINYLAVDRRWSVMDPGERLDRINHPLETILSGPMSIAQFAVAVIGVMAISSEYATGMIRSTLQAQPRRLTVVSAKIAVMAALMLVVGEIVSFAAFFVGDAVVGGHIPVSLNDSGVLRSVIGAGLYLTTLALFSLAVGAIVRHTAGAITAVLGFILVISQLTGLLPDSWGRHVNAWMPTNAGELIFQQHSDPQDLLTPWQGLGVFALWTVVLLVLGSYLLRRRDA
jgi:ABC-2 type transport system permease protein